MEFPDKTRPPTPERKKLVPVVTSAQHVKRPATRRVLDSFFAESPAELLAKIASDVIVPNIKVGVEQAGRAFLAGMLWGRSQGGATDIHSVTRGTVIGGPSINYSAVSSGGPPAIAPPAPRAGGVYRDLIVSTQEEAEQLLASLYALLNEYRVVAVADLYELANMTVSEGSANNYGWMSLDSARISRVREGYRLELPRPTLI